MEQVRIIPFDHPLHYHEVLALLPKTPDRGPYWNWQYEGCTRSGDSLIKPLVAVSDGAVVGFNGVIAARLWVDGRFLEGAWSCDFAVAEAARRAGIGRRIKQQLLDTSSLLLVSGASEDAARLHKSMGSDLSLVTRSFRRIIRPLGMKDQALKTFQAFQRLLNRRIKNSDSSYSLNDTIPGQEELDGLWERCQDGYKRVVIRDARYLRWRYAEHPFAKYRYLAARGPDAGLIALLVVREYQGIAHIIDYVGPSGALSVKAGLVAAAVSLFEGADSWVTFTSDSELGTALRANGFYQTRAIHRFYVMASAKESVNSTDWFIMPGDSDGDVLRVAQDYQGPEYVFAGETRSS